MKSTDRLQGRKIMIKREQVSPLNTKKSNQIINGEKTIHVRRHSVMGSKINQRGQFIGGQSHQSSKQIKSLSKHKQIKEEQYFYENEKTQKFSTNLLKETDSLGLRKDFMEKSSYKYINMIGKGGFGKVWKVKHISTGQVFALKEMSKATVIAKRSVQSILNERRLLSTLKHRYLVNMVYAFQDRTSLYLVMNLMQGGDLRYHIAKRHNFTELQTRFLVATIILSLQYLHKKMIIHRDVKPQNIVFDDKGYAHLTDLGIAKYIRTQNFQDTSGTPGYMAPEVMFHHNHRFQVDFFAIGVIIYEIMMGRRPYLGKNRQQIKQLILVKQAIIKKRQIPEGWSIQSADFVNKLLQRKPIKRLGWGGISELKQHRWLVNFPWKQLANQELQSPFKQKYNPLQVRYRVTELETQYKKLLNKNKEMLQKGNLQEYFNGYTYQGLAETHELSKSTYLFK